MLFTINLRPEIDTLQLKELSKRNVEADVLRLDLVHPVVSGNKWFKLKEYLPEAMEQNKSAIITFGGAFSNHILATAALCKELGLKSVGIIRGEKPASFSHTLQDVMNCGMDLFFVEREKYKIKEISVEVITKYPDAYIINEGGYGLPGARGAAAILDPIDSNQYTHILVAVGTGTTLAGLTEVSTEEQSLIGISVLKNNFDLQDEINHLLSPRNRNRFQLLHQFHFGGYAKYTNELILFMNDWFNDTGIPSDFVYTGKLLLIHSGGLQGNNSLKKGTLIF
jgi:1-aminocyclopropane-1-carboxylate deaminase